MERTDIVGCAPASLPLPAALASDHRGTKLKAELRERLEGAGLEVFDYIANVVWQVVRPQRSARSG